jgi:energy-coupling factor transporter transmembrane protein EcfT
MKIKNIGNSKLDTFYTARDVYIGNTSSFFNTSADQSGVDSSMLRYMGTLMHPISNAYIVAAVGLVAFSVSYGWWLLLIIPMMLLSGVKGAVVMLICSMCLWMVWTFTENRRFLLMCGLGLMVAYVGYGLATGLNGGDYHVIGFMGGVRGLTHVPWGHGIGVGGNLSTTAENGFNWQDFQHGGVADFALESAVGVFFYQMGIASFAVLAVPIVLLRMAPFGTTWRRRLKPRRADMIFIVLGCIAVNGVFQEEAYSPYAAGLYTLLAAVLVANGRRETSVMVQERLPHLARMAHG